MGFMVFLENFERAQWAVWIIYRNVSCTYCITMAETVTKQLSRVSCDAGWYRRKEGLIESVDSMKRHYLEATNCAFAMASGDLNTLLLSVAGRLVTWVWVWNTSGWRSCKCDSFGPKTLEDLSTNYGMFATRQRYFISKMESLYTGILV